MDVVIISDAKTDALSDLTLQAIESCGDHNIIVVESSDIRWANCINVNTIEPFSYNRYLNIGATYGTSEYIGFFNNDVIFRPGWDRIIETMQRHKCESASTYCPKHWGHKNLKGVRIGKTPGRELAGWAIITTRAWWERMGGFDEDGKFWCSENRYWHQLMDAKVKHVIDCSCVVEHLGSKTLHTLDTETRTDYEVHEVQRYNKQFKKNLFGWGNG